MPKPRAAEIIDFGNMETSDGVATVLGKLSLAN